MKLSEDAKKWADAVLHKSTYEIAVWGEEDQRRIRALRTKSDPKFALMRQHYEERIRRAFKGLINAYVEGYRMDEALIDDEDTEEIIQQVRKIIDSQLNHVTNSVIGSRDFVHPYTGEKIPNMDEYLGRRFENLIGEAAIELNLVRNQLVLEKKQRERNIKTYNQINVYGDNHGNIQQGGENNNQIINPKEGK
jgi:transcriptional regulator of met regulon